MASDSRRTRRLIRLEKETYPEDIAASQGSGFLIRSNALQKSKLALSRAAQYTKDSKPAAAEMQRKEAAKFSKSLDDAVGGPTRERDALMRQHMVSSKSSPFLSGTPTFTTGQNSQLSYMESNLRANKTQTVTILHSERALENPHNTREQEVLLPHGQLFSERVGMLHVTPMGGKVRPIFIDKTGEKPKLFLGSAAVRRFKELSQK